MLILPSRSTAIPNAPQHWGLIEIGRTVDDATIVFFPQPWALGRFRFTFTRRLVFASLYCFFFRRVSTICVAALGYGIAGLMLVPAALQVGYLVGLFFCRRSLLGRYRAFGHWATTSGDGATEACNPPSDFASQWECHRKRSSMSTNQCRSLAR
jgi:hypothetical protein